MGVHVGNSIGKAEAEVLKSQMEATEEHGSVERLFPPKPVNQASDSNDSKGSLKQEPALKLVACPLGEKGEQIGMYNPQALAGRALSLTSALSPDYMQSYLSGLEDLMALKRLPEPSRRRR